MDEGDDALMGTGSKDEEQIAARRHEGAELPADKGAGARQVRWWRTHTSKGKTRTQTKRNGWFECAGESCEQANGM